jgi:hypothetical protein
MANMERPPEDPFARISGSYKNAVQVTKVLAWARDHAHLISPAYACARLPEGCEVGISIVWVDPKTDAHDVGMGKFGLLKHALNRISSAAGIRFDPHASGRVDDGSDPFYVHWRSVGAWRHLDGSILPIVGDREMDLRDGSAQVERVYKTSRDAEKQVREMRAFIMGHAQSKAELRAIRKALGIRSYTAQELEKPFVVVNLAFTGFSEDPSIRRENAAAIRNSMLGGAQALFGPPPGNTVTTPALPMASNVPIQIGHAPPPVGSTRAELDDDSAPVLPQGNTIDTTATPVPESARAPRTAARSQAAPPAPATTSQASGARKPSGFVMKFGKTKGTPIEDATDRDLQWSSETIAKSIDDPDKARFREQNERELAAIRAEIAYRAGGGGASQTSGGSAGDDFQGQYASDDSEIPF